MSAGYAAPVLRRFAKAEVRRRRWDSLLASAYAYALPNHDALGNERAGRQGDIDIFDDTAVQAVDWKKNRLHGLLFPPFREWMDFDDEAPEDAATGQDRSAWKEYLKLCRSRFHSAIERSNFHIEVDPALAEAFVSVGALLLHFGTPEDPLRFEAVPASQLVLEEAVDGVIRTVFRRWQPPFSEIATRFPGAKPPEDLRQKHQGKDDTRVDIVEAVIFDQTRGSYHYSVWAVDGEHCLLERRDEASSPWVVFRIDKAPGEVMGRGPVLKCLAAVKTANKVVELNLKNAAIAVTGIWQADDDGVLNPATIKLVPGAIIPVAPNSRGLQPLQPPGKFDLSQIILNDLQEKIRRTIMGPTLPPTDAGARTAYEIGERRAEEQAIELPMSLRLLAELDFPLATRILHLLSHESMASSPYYIPPFEVNEQKIAPKPASPLVRLQDRAEAEAAHRAYLAALQADPQTTAGLVNRPKYLRQFLENNGFPPEHFQTERDMAKFEAMVRSEQAKLEAQARQDAQAQGGGGNGMA